MRDRQARMLSDGFLFLEAPKWRNGKIWISDVFASKVYTVTPEGEREEVCLVPGRPAGLGVMADGRLIIASQAERKLFQ